MFDDLHANHRGQRDPVAVADALRALPLESPPRSAWPRLAARLAQRRSRPFRPWPLALAASLLLALTLGGYLHIAADPPPPAGGLTSDPLRPVLAESAQLEALIANTSDEIGRAHV